MGVYVLAIDEDYHVAVARSLVETPHGALVAVSDESGKKGHLALAESYDEAVTYAEDYANKGWRAVVWELPARRPVVQDDEDES